MLIQCSPFGFGVLSLWKAWKSQWTCGCSPGIKSTKQLTRFLMTRSPTHHRGLSRIPMLCHWLKTKLSSVRKCMLQLVPVYLDERLLLGVDRTMTLKFCIHWLWSFFNTTGVVDNSFSISIDVFIYWYIYTSKFFYKKNLQNPFRGYPDLNQVLLVLLPLYPSFDRYSW